VGLGKQGLLLLFEAAFLAYAGLIGGPLLGNVEEAMDAVVLGLVCLYVHLLLGIDLIVYLRACLSV
jgi:hypothetical protein